MLQLGVPKIYGDSSRCVKHASMLILGGSGEMSSPSGKFLNLGVRRLNLEAFSVVLAVNQTLVL